jgi:hypothetical protein
LSQLSYTVNSRMAQKDNAGAGTTIFVGVLFNGLWVAWFWWAIHLKHNADFASNVAGLLFTGLALLVISICLIRIMLTFIIGLVASPFILIYGILYLFYSLILYSISPYFVLCYRKQTTQFTKSSKCRLCLNCESLVEKSPLLSGGSWIFTRPIQVHPFHDYSRLIESAQTCHLCNLLYKSITEVEELTSTTKQVVQMAPDNSKHLDDVAKLSSTDETAKPTKCLSTASSSDATRKPESIDTTSRLQVVVRARKSLFETALSLQISGNNNLKSVPVCITIRTGMFGRTKCRFHAYFDADIASQHKCSDSSTTKSHEHLMQAKEWISKCASDHPLCENVFVPKESKVYLPKRLLNVNTSYGDTVVSLISTKDLKPYCNIDYFALSHCWGEKMSIKLTSQNADEIKNMKLEDLPTTFQDAVSITRSMGIPFLWIDSLCILQDDETEWETQSATMGLVYANAKCVLSASASKDSTGGCFSSRELFRSNCSLGTLGTVSIIAESGDQNLQIPKLFDEKVDDAILSTRAWTFQERYLAVRLLHFSSGTVLFECNTMIASEYNPSGQIYPLRASVRSDGLLHSPADCEVTRRSVPKYITVRNHNGFTSKQRRQKIRKLNPKYTAQLEKVKLLSKASARLGMRGSFDLLWRFCGTQLRERVEFHHSWYDMVEQYSTRYLTKGQDKLKAITGIAYFIQSNTGFKYAAGLWQEALPFNLLWVLSGKAQSRPARPLPTWSWASVDGRISHRLKPQGTFQSYNTMSDIFSTAVEKPHFDSTWHDITPLISNMVVNPTEEINNLVLNATLSLSGCLHKLNSLDVNVVYDTSYEYDTETLFCLPVLSFKNYQVHPIIRAVQLHGIILRAAPAENKEQFERAGYFWIAESSVVQELLTRHNEPKIIEII